VSLASLIASSKPSKRRDRDHRAEDLLLEHAHLVVALEHRRRDVVAAGEIAAERDALAAEADPRALLLADVDVAQDLLELIVGRLGADLGVGVERIAGDEAAGARHRQLEELAVDLLVDQRARRARAHLALVEREHAEALERLLPEVVVVREHVGEEDVGRLAAQLERHRDQVLGRVLHDQAAGGGLAGERDLADATVRRQRLAGLDAEAVDDVQHAGRQSPWPPAQRASRIVAGVCSAGLSTTQLPAASAGASFHVAISSGKFHGMI
jgi:hypothetical protein